MLFQNGTEPIEDSNLRSSDIENIAKQKPFEELTLKE
jgi:hypothetical protein